MFFTTIEDEANKSGFKIQNIFNRICGNIKEIFSNTAPEFTFDSNLIDSLQFDESALLQYKLAIENGMSSTEAFAATMKDASIEAQNFAKENKITGETLAAFTADQKKSEVARIAQNKSISNIKAIMSEFNSGMASTNLSQQEFTEGVSQSNSSLGKYLSNVSVGEASMRGYARSLVSAKVATIGLQIATTALNSLIGMGIGLLISGAISGISYLLHYEENLIKKSEEAAESIKDLHDSFKNNSDTVTEIAQEFAELSKGVDSLSGENISLSTDDYAKFLELSNQLAEIFPTLSRSYDENGNAILSFSGDVDTVVASLQDLLDVQRQITNQQISEKLPDLYNGIISKSRNFNKDIDEYQAKINEIKTSYDDITSSDFPTRFREQMQNGLLVVSGTGESLEELNNKNDNYIKLLDELGIEYEYLSTDYAKNKENIEVPISFTYIIDDEDIDKKKDKLLSGIQDLASDYQTEIDNLNSNKQSSKNQNEGNWKSLLSSISAWLSTDSSYKAMEDSLQFSVQKMISNIDFSSLNKNSWDEVEGFIEQNILKPISSASPEVKKSIVELFSLDSSDLSFVEYKNKVSKGIELIAENLGIDQKEISEWFGFDTVWEKYEDICDKIRDKFNLPQELVNSLSPDEITNAWDYIENYGITSWGDLQKFIKSKKLIDSFNVDDIETLKTALDDLKGTYENVEGVIKDYNENGYYTLDNLKSLLELNPEYINTLIDENGQVNLNSQAYKQYVAEKAKLLVVDQIKSLYEKILAMTTEEAQAYANAIAYNTEAKSLDDLIVATTKYYMLLAHAKDTQNNTTVYTESLQRSFGTVANYAAIYNSWLDSLNTSTNEFSASTEKNTSAIDAQKEALENEKSALEDSKKALEEYQSSLKAAQDDIKSLIDITVDYIKQLKEDEKEALESQKSAYDEIVNKKKEALQLAKEEKEINDEIADKQNSVIKDTLSLSVANLDDSSSGKKTQKQAKDNLSKSSKDLRDKLYDNEYDMRVTALEKEQEERDAWYDKQVSKIDEYLSNARQLYEDACIMIDNDNGILYQNLWDYTYKYTTKTKAEFDYLWNSAQIAICNYRGENDTLIGVMEILQGKIYAVDGDIANLDGNIANLDGAINATNSTINSTSGAIDNVSNSLDGLGSSISNYLNQLNELSNANVNIDNNSPKYLGRGYDAQSGKYYFSLGYNGREYYGYVGDSSDTENVRAKAADLILKEIYKYNSFNDVNARLIKDTIIKGKFAKGTRNAPAGVSITQEDGLEAIFGKLSQGQYTLMSQGSQVFNSDMTDKLYNFASDPQKFMSNFIDRIDYSGFLNSRQSSYEYYARKIANNIDSSKNHGDITVNSAPIYIQGDATQSTINALRKERDKIKDDLVNDLIKYRERKMRATIR